MNHLVLHLDLASPQAWSGFQRLPEALAGLPCWVEIGPAAADVPSPLGDTAPLWRWALACGTPGIPPSRWHTERLLRAVWAVGDEAEAPAAGRSCAQALAWLSGQRSPLRSPDSAEVVRECAALLAVSRQRCAGHGAGAAAAVWWPADGSCWVGEAAFEPLAQALRQRGRG